MYLHRAVASSGATIDFLMSAFARFGVAQRLFHQTLSDPSHPQPRFISTDKARLYCSAISEVKAEGILRRR